MSKLTIEWSIREDRGRVYVREKIGAGTGHVEFEVPDRVTAKELIEERKTSTHRLVERVRAELLQRLAGPPPTPAAL